MLQRKSISTNLMPPPSSTLLMVCAKFARGTRLREQRRAGHVVSAVTAVFTLRCCRGGLDPTHKQARRAACCGPGARAHGRATDLFERAAVEHLEAGRGPNRKAALVLVEPDVKDLVHGRRRQVYTA